VDFVKTPDQFVPGVQKFSGSLYLEGLKFLPNGKTAVPWFGWTRGVVMHLGGDHTAARYAIKEIAGAKYMFFEWKSGDYIIRHQKPEYYVLRKK
jgi:bla regulator protein BlaR1